MHLKYTPVLMLFLISLLWISGCTETAADSPTVTPQIIYVTVTVTPSPTPTHCYWDPVKMACSDKPVTAAPTTVARVVTDAPTAAAAGPDPILHRWIRRYPASGGYAGYEFKFYPEGTVVYKEGTTEMVSSNVKIPTPTSQGSGTWTKLSEGHYLVKVNPVGVSGAPLVREYVIVAADATYPQHLVSDYEQSFVDATWKTGNIHDYPVDIFYLERGKID
jgi:hypothetical protein